MRVSIHVELDNLNKGVEFTQVENVVEPTSELDSQEIMGVTPCPSDHVTYRLSPWALWSGGTKPLPTVLVVCTTTWTTENVTMGGSSQKGGNRLQGSAEVRFDGQGLDISDLLDHLLLHFRSLKQCCVQIRRDLIG